MILIKGDNMHYELVVEFSIVDFEIHPNDISRLLGVIPQRQFQKGDLIDPKVGIHYKENGWVLSSKLNQNTELDDNLLDLLKIFKSNLSGFIEICNKYDSELSIMLTIYHQKNNNEEEHNTPALHFDKEIIKLLAELNSEIDIDLYVLPIA